LEMIGAKDAKELSAALKGIKAAAPNTT
jgi:hypothetical protein